MKLSKLGYNKKWIRFGILTEENIAAQLAHFEESKGELPESYRYTSYLNWLGKKTSLSNREVEKYMELTLEDPNPEMAGAAAKALFESPLVTEAQFNILRLQFPAFGDWTDKVIQRETLNRRLKKEGITPELLHECLQFKNEFADNRFLVQIIEKTEEIDVLSTIKDAGVGKRIRTLADKKINKIIRSQQA